MLITIHNVRELQADLGRSVVERSRYIDPLKPSKWWQRLLSFLFDRPQYILLKSLTIRLRSGDVIKIPEGFIWDLSSVPRILWWILPPDGDFELAALIHDYLYKSKLWPQKKADEEMFAWSKAVAGTEGRNSWSDIDNWIRYAGVRAFGWAVYKRRKSA